MQSFCIKVRIFRAKDAILERLVRNGYAVDQKRLVHAEKASELD